MDGENNMSYTIALAGNPNSGKTTMFNKLTGANQRVGNWPGVTVDRKTGKIRGTDYELVDLPGIYSMSPYSPEEIVSRHFLVKDRPDGIINIVDATNLERNLFLTYQIIDMGIPTVIALNMMDQVRKAGDQIDVEKLSKELGCPIVPVSALNGEGIKELVEAVGKACASGKGPEPLFFDGDVEETIAEAQSALKGKVPDEALRFSAVKLVENDEEICKDHTDAVEAISDAVKKLESAKDDEADSIIADERYTRISSIVSSAVKWAPRSEKGSFSDRVDRIVTSRIWGIPIFIGVLACIFLGVIGFSTYDDSFKIVGIGSWCTEMLNAFIEDPIQSGLAEWCASAGVSEPMTDLLVNGIVGGVGAVIGFLPQMLILFLVMCILEDIGYMARIAFVMDRVFRHFGLSGKSLIPIIVGTGCGVPGIMASRTIESERDRRITAMTTTFIPCGAKLPIISIMVAFVFGGNGLIAVLAYIVGIICILISGLILKKFRSLSGPATPFIMELPPYHIPSAVNVIKGTLDRGWAFVKKAGTIILLASILIWVLSHYDASLTYLTEDRMGESILAAIGGALHWIFVPLGWSQTGENWEFTVGAITGLIAKENLVNTLDILLGDSAEIGSRLTYAAGLSLLFFNLICAPCFAAIGAMHRELGSWKDTGIAVGYQCILAYCVALVFFGIVGCFSGMNSVNGVDYGAPLASTIAAIVVIAIFAYILWAKDPFKQLNGSEEEC